MEQPATPDDADAVATRRVIYAVGFLRAVATSLGAVSVGAYLARRGIGEAEAGAILSVGLTGAVIAAVVATFAADRIGRRRFLVVVAALSALGTALIVVAEGPVQLAAAAFVGMVNGMGRDRGAALILEQAALPATSTDARRTGVIAVYTMLQDLGHAIGAAAAGLPRLVTGAPAHDASPDKVAILACAALAIAGAVLYGRLGRALDAATPVSGAAPVKASPETRRILVKISALFGLDSLAGGFLTQAMLTYFFFDRFGVDELTVGLLFAAARVMNAGSHLAAAWLARRIGLVNTMVFTHIPSSVLLVTVAIAPSFPVAVVLFLLREGLVEMDVPTRQSYVLAVVAPHERTLASGVTQLVRLAGWAVGPLIAGALMEGVSLIVPLVAAAAMKIVYDLLLWRAFRSIKPPEEREV
jgi:MFS family permease